MKRSRIFNRLPPETIEEIFYKLPVKSLLRFKCVSKSCRSCISSRDFIAEHLNQSTITGTDFSRHNLILTYKNRGYCVSSCCSSCCIGSLLNNNNNDGDYEAISPCLGSNPSIPIPSLKDNSFSSFNLLGSCYGLTLISIKKELYLWNPSTRKSRNIVDPSGILHRSIYGFGYDETTDDYKVACFLSIQVGAEPHQTEIHMYSSVANSWKKARDFDRGLLPDGTGKFVNGKLHWLAYKQAEGRDTRSTWYIVSLDLVKEYKYRVTPSPDCISGCNPVLDDLGGYLSLIRRDYAIKSMDVWVMKEESCWSKIWTFPDRIGYCPTSRPKPLWLKENGDVVVAIGSDVIIYRGKDKLRQYSVDNMFNATIEPIIYVESLVSPFPIWGWQ